MLKTLTLLIAMFLVPPMFANAKHHLPSKPPIPSAGKSSGPEQQVPAAQQKQSTDDKRGTQDAPIVVKVLNPPDAEAKATQDAEDREAKTASEWWNKIFSGGLVIVGFVQAVTLFYTALVTNKAANAAKLAATVAEKSLFDLEGPFLYPVIKSGTLENDLNWFVIFDHPSSVVPVKSPTVSFAIKNVGRSTALLRSVAATVEHLTKMVAKPRVEFLANYAIEPIVDPQAETATQFTQQLIIPIDRDANDSITKGDSHIFLYGEIVFSDVLGTDYIQTFCLSYDRHAKRFVPLGSKYNRRTRQKPEEA